MYDRPRDSRSETILICDHRGAGLARAAGPLRGAGFAVEVCDHPGATRALLAQGPPDLLLVDPLVPGGAVELEELAQALRRAPLTPVLLVAEPDAPRAALEAATALALPVHGVLRRDAGAEELRWHVEHLLQEGARARELADLRYRAAHDDLTDLMRPLSFQARVEEHVSASQRHELDLALVLIDLDSFGQVNKLYDHTVGDRVLAHVAHVIRQNLRSEDVAGRLGGDEFAILLPFTGPLQAAATVRRLCGMIHELSGSVDGTGGELRVSASLGFETTRGGELDSAATLRRHAELALRRAKQAGGNRGVYYRSGG